MPALESRDLRVHLSLEVGCVLRALLCVVKGAKLLHMLALARLLQNH